MKITPHCATRNHPPGEENGTVKPELGAWGEQRPGSLYLAKVMALGKAIVPLRALCSGKEGEKTVKNPKYI